jgi:hypothetical protein
VIAVLKFEGKAKERIAIALRPFKLCAFKSDRRGARLDHGTHSGLSALFAIPSGFARVRL